MINFITKIISNTVNILNIIALSVLIPLRISLLLVGSLIFVVFLVLQKVESLFLHK
jgi:hypothetical protein